MNDVRESIAIATYRPSSSEDMDWFSSEELRVEEARFLAGRGNGGEAARIYTELILENTDCAPALEGLGAFFLDAGEPLKALPLYEQLFRVYFARREGRGIGRAAVVLARIEKRLGRLERAYMYYQRAALFDKENIEALVGLGRECVRRKKKNVAAAAVKRALALLADRQENPSK